MKIIHYACVLCFAVSVGASAEAQNPAPVVEVYPNCGAFNPGEFEGSWKIYRTQKHEESHEHIPYGSRIILTPNSPNEKEFTLRVPRKAVVELTSVCEKERWVLIGGEIDFEGVPHTISISRKDDHQDNFDEECNNVKKFKHDEVIDLCKMVTGNHYDRHILLDFKNKQDANLEGSKSGTIAAPIHPGHTHGGSSEG